MIKINNFQFRCVINYYRLIVSISFFSFSMVLMSQEYDISTYLLDDWYFLSEPDESCGFDSAYNEISFTETYYHFIKECNRFEYTFYYKIVDDSIIGFSDSNNVVLRGTFKMVDTMRFKIITKDSELVFFRLIDSDYMLSDYLLDNIAISGLKLNVSSKVSNTILTPCSNFYYACLKRREFWLRLERREMKKEDVIKWANDMIKYCDTAYEVHRYEEFTSRVNDIF